MLTLSSWSIKLLLFPLSSRVLFNWLPPQNIHWRKTWAMVAEIRDVAYFILFVHSNTSSNLSNSLFLRRLYLIWWESYSNYLVSCYDDIFSFFSYNTDVTNLLQVLLLMATALNVRILGPASDGGIDSLPMELRKRQQRIAEITEMIHVSSCFCCLFSFSVFTFLSKLLTPVLINTDDLSIYYWVSYYQLLCGWIPNHKF